MEEPDKVEEKWRNPDGTLKAGHPPMGGRPKGQSLKEYWRQRFSEMSDEERVEFTAKVGNEMIWKMAEGNPAQDTDITTKGEKLVFPILGGITNEVSKDHSGRQDTETQEAA